MPSDPLATPWRPQPRIKVKALGLHWREGRLLAAEVYDDAGHLKGVRPLGGTIEFGETWQQALKREFLEELQVEVMVSGAPLVLENLYLHEGATGHEIIFAAAVEFPDGAFENLDEILFHEDNGQLCRARWFDLDALERDGVAVFPDGLREALKGL
ncbi:putative MutT/nudix family protein [Roseobacter sp. SK209-2-6]|uniref:NUDIX hydrolase n=1 Tax=Roseobacter sp. SK209-2-6 TaxID=388739 RepID=UPI0000F3E79A|nr:NUDIX domain-containing protein [Roseobacter sp. SK209-2-6]EBA16239.1 putative MutT/nudix family protein [Roseobacter sp. SK209-2-6]